MTEPTPYQGMSLAVIAELLAYVQAFDKNFVPDELDVRAYHVVAQDHRWTHHDAMTAIRRWGGDHPEGQRLDPALLNRLIRTARQDRAMRQPEDRALDTEHGQRTDRDRADVFTQWAAAMAESKLRSRRQRDAVLAHPDLAQQLRSPLIGYSRPENWNGWIPPEDVSGFRGFGRNASHRRAALVTLVAEAQRREEEAK